MTSHGKAIIAIMILLFGAGGAILIYGLRPKAKKVEPPRNLLTVEAITVERESIRVDVPTQGVLEPLTETRVAAEVAGKVVRVSPKFEVGETFAVDETILEIDPSDYNANVAQAESALAETKLALEMEIAREQQALREWEKLGDGEEPTELVLRKPQMKSAKAKVKAAEAALEKARRDLDRTVIRAPYVCRIRVKHTDIGSYLAPGAAIAELYRIDILEVRLPVSLEDFSFLSSDASSMVQLEAEVAGKKHVWPAEIVRTEGVVDRTSRSVFLVARIDPGTVGDESSRFLTPGMFVKASVQGVALENTFRIPRKAVYVVDGTDRVLVIDEKNRVSYREVKVVRTEHHYVAVSEGLNDGERISVTVIETVIDGETEVVIDTLDGTKLERERNPNENQPGKGAMQVP